MRVLIVIHLPRRLRGVLNIPISATKTLEATGIIVLNFVVIPTVVNEFLQAF